MTQLTVLLKTAPGDQASRQTLRQLEAVTHASLLATPLKASKITTTGITAQQQARHQLVSQHALKWTVGVTGILVIALWLGLRSFLLSALVTGGLAALAISSWGWTQLIMTQWQHAGLLSSAVFLSSLVILALHWLTVTLMASTVKIGSTTLMPSGYRPTSMLVDNSSGRLRCWNAATCCHSG